MKTPCAGPWVWMGVLVVASLGATACAAPTCDAPLELCDGVCANLEDNSAHCGACGIACGENEVCDNGTCVAEACAGQDCGCESVTCPQGATCAQGECVCSGGLALCEAGCTDLETDPRSCGSCDHACPESMKCAGGVCLPTCDEAGLVECGGVCTNTLYDPTSCGSCGQACPGGTVCIQAQCSCPDLSQSLCGGACVDTSWDQSNCGFCGHDCGPGGSCWEGSCECVSGETCGGTCVDTWSDPQNCGGCFQSCGAGQACVQGTCSCPADPCGICGVTDLGSTVPQMVNGTTTGQPNHVDPWCGAQGTGDRVFRFVAPEAGVYTFDTFGSSFDTVLSAMSELIGPASASVALMIWGERSPMLPLARPSVRQDAGRPGAARKSSVCSPRNQVISPISPPATICRASCEAGVRM